MMKLLLSLVAVTSVGAQAQAQNNNMGGVKLVSSKPLMLVSGSKSNICGTPLGGSSVECVQPENAISTVKNPTGIALSRSGNCVWNAKSVKCYGERAPIYLAEVPVLKEIVSISLGSVEYANNACAIEKTPSGNKVKCWGESAIMNPVPGEVVDPTIIAVGAVTACAVHSEGAINCWGIEIPGTPERTRAPRKMLLSNLHGCLNDAFGLTCWGTSPEGRAVTVPEDLQSPGQIEDFSLGSEHTCALTTSAEVKCWGDNTYGQSNVPALKNPISVIAFNNTSCATDADGIKCWGDTDLFKADPYVPYRPPTRGDYHRTRATYPY